MSSVRHTPYDGSAPPFRIGLSPVPAEERIEVDQHLEFYLAEKDRLLDEMPDAVFVEEADTRAAQQEVLDFVAGTVTTCFPEHYARIGDCMHINTGDRSVDIGDEKVAPLIRAARLVQEDLVIMRRDDSGWRLVAACVCFPTSWTLQEKFGLPMQQVHGPVPAFGPGSRNAHMIERIFDNLKTDQPVRRLNWTIYSDDVLHHGTRADEHLKRRSKELNVANAFLRVEHQTLTKLQKSGDILFTIRIHIDPMSILRSLPERASVCENLAGMLEQLDDKQLDYKSMHELRDGLVSELRELANAMR